MMQKDIFDKDNVEIIYNPIYKTKLYLFGSIDLSSTYTNDICELFDKVNPNQVFIQSCPKRFSSFNLWSINGLKIMNIMVTKKSSKISYSNEQSFFTNCWYQIIRFIHFILYMILNVWTIYILKLPEQIDMSFAIKKSVEYNSFCILGDQFISEILFHLSNIPLWEMIKFVFWYAIPMSLSYKKSYNDMDKMKILSKTWNQIHNNLPNIYNIMIKNRNRHMAEILINCKGPNIIVIVDYIHLQGLKKCCKELIDTYSTFKKTNQVHTNTIEKIYDTNVPKNIFLFV